MGELPLLILLGCPFQGPQAKWARRHSLVTRALLLVALIAIGVHAQDDSQDAQDRQDAIQAVSLVLDGVCPLSIKQFGASCEGGAYMTPNQACLNFEGGNHVVSLEEDPYPKWLIASQMLASGEKRYIIHTAQTARYTWCDRQILSVPLLCGTGEGNDILDLWKEVDDSGRQQWDIQPVPGRDATYTFRIHGGRPNCTLEYVSASSTCGGILEIGAGPASSTQQWVITTSDDDDCPAVFDLASVPVYVAPPQEDEAPPPPASTAVTARNRFSAVVMLVATGFCCLVLGKFV